jgi:hypothetical protein
MLSSPITAKGTFMIRICCPITGPAPNSSRATVAPRMTTLAAERISAGVKARPSASGQSRTSRKSSFTPSTEVVQLALPAITGAEPLTMPATAEMPGTLARISARSRSDSGMAVPSPARRPPEVKEPGWSTSRLVPSALMRASMASPAPVATDTITITDATPMITPSMARKLRIALSLSAASATLKESNRLNASRPLRFCRREQKTAVRPFGDVGLMGDDDHGDAARIQLFE